ncbi:Response regulator receiver domain [Granulibacter bethesdensis]|uniref:Response regulator receiver domain n=1 Tax=Granulibacter bethesdensis TaxID=364410 RepID=A0AAC9K7G0_9PROT|nr:response regulator [Granulibacter bethesdensis]APH54415.1 Response regulator receiver domain [Granulibacter bethesdensis]APH62000.1 Response regulator receiver domain [Granulibacter bethesdensis]
MAKLVLLAEDELFIALDLQIILEEAGCTIIGPLATLDETLSALDDLKGTKLTAALLDVRLADKDIFPAADWLHQAGVPLLFHSAHADEDILRQRYPEAAIFPKPCALDELCHIIRRIVE